MKNLTIVCKDFELTSALKQKLEEKLSSLLKYLKESEDSVTFNARLGKTSNHHNNGKIYYVEVSVHSPHKNYGARIEAEEIYAAIDLIRDELAQNINHHKEKIRDLSRKEEIKFKQEIRSIE